MDNTLRYIGVAYENLIYLIQVIAARAIAEREAREARGEVEDDEDDSLPTIRVGLVDADGHYTDVEPDL